MCGAGGATVIVAGGNAFFIGGNGGGVVFAPFFRAPQGVPGGGLLEVIARAIELVVVKGEDAQGKGGFALALFCRLLQEVARFCHVLLDVAAFAVLLTQLALRGGISGGGLRFYAFVVVEGIRVIQFAP